MRTVVILFSCLCLLIGCKKDSEEALYGNEECLPKDVSFSIYVLPLIKNSCAITGCHVQGGSGNGVFENYDQVKSKVDNGSFLQRVVISRDMPPSGNLSSCEIETIRQWLIEGALNN